MDSRDKKKKRKGNVDDENHFPKKEVTNEARMNSWCAIAIKVLIQALRRRD